MQAYSSLFFYWIQRKGSYFHYRFSWTLFQSNSSAKSYNVKKCSIWIYLHPCYMHQMYSPYFFHPTTYRSYFLIMLQKGSLEIGFFVYGNSSTSKSVWNRVIDCCFHVIMLSFKKCISWSFLWLWFTIYIACGFWILTLHMTCKLVAILTAG